jgi:hypothetical protein
LKHPASTVIIQLCIRCQRAALSGAREEAVRLADLVNNLEREFPDAAAEVQAIFPQSLEET